jgi:hypothetical protein
MLSDAALIFPRPSADEVLSNLTDFFFTDALQKEVNLELAERKKIIEILKKMGEKGDINFRDIAQLLQVSGHSINTIISLLGISQERFLGIFSLKSIGDKKPGETMGMETIKTRIKKDINFVNDISKLLIFGKNDKELVGRVPPFDLEKLNKEKLLLRKDALVDSLLRLGLKGRFDAKKGTILEDHIEEVLKAIGVQYIRGEILLQGLSRKLDFVVPNEKEPCILIESGLFETTARELSDKARVEILGTEEIERLYPQARFIRVTDGIGWRRRGGQDLHNLIQASHYFLVFNTLGLLDKIIKHYVPKNFFKA